MAGLQFDNRLSAGNVIVVIGMVASVAGAWGVWTKTTETIAGELSKQSSRIEAHEARIRVMETTAARQDERMILILDSLRKIESRLERP